MPMTKPFIMPLLGTLLLLAACTSQTDHGGKTPLVEVNGAYLYHEDLQAILPLNINPADSTAFAERCIQNWVEEQLLYMQAERNIRSSKHIEQMVEEYRKTLILQEYQQQLIEQKLGNEITEEEMRAFYNDNPTLFVLKEPAIQGLFIKVPKTASGLDELRKWYTHNDDASMEKIEKYCLQNAVIYEYFYDHWVPLSDLDGKINADLVDLNQLSVSKDFEAEDDEFCYLLHVENFVLNGKVKPYDLARSDIADMLSNTRKVDFIKKVRNDLYDRAIDMGRVKRFYTEEFPEK